MVYKILLKSQVQEQSGTFPGTSRNSNTEKQEPNEDSCQNNSRPEIGTSIYRLLQCITSEPNEASYS